MFTYRPATGSPVFWILLGSAALSAGCSSGDPSTAGGLSPTSTGATTSAQGGGANTGGAGGSAQGSGANTSSTGGAGGSDQGSGATTSSTGEGTSTSTGSGGAGGASGPWPWMFDHDGWWATGGSAPGASDVTASPLLNMATTPPTPNPGSPLIGAGSKHGLTPFDFFGNPRNGRADIGAVEGP